MRACVFLLFVSFSFVMMAFGMRVRAFDLPKLGREQTFKHIFALASKPWHLCVFDRTSLTQKVFNGFGF